MPIYRFPVTLEAGVQLGPYRVVEQLGAGGQGKVYRATDTRLGRDVALKVLSDELADVPVALARFDREARTAAALSHSNILALYDYGNHDGRVFAVMELLHGESLDRPISRGRMSWTQAVEIGAAIADGLAAAHATGIVHRDLKPSNVFVTKDGVIKILDFGLATPARSVTTHLEPTSHTTVAAVTQEGTIVGSPGYMSPEQVRGEPPDPRWDIFSLGCILAEMLTGRRAFPGNTAESVAAVLRDEPQGLADSGGQIPPTVEAVVRRCLEKHPDRRFQSARDLAFALRALMAGSTRVDTPAEASRNWGRIAARTAFLLVLVAVTAGVWFGLRSERVTSIVVLPFLNRSGDPAQDALAEGVADQLIADLARIPTLRVISRTSAASLKGTGEPLADIARELSVTKVLEGSVKRTGTRVAVTANLVDAPTETQEWSAHYEPEMRDVLSVLREIAEQVAGKVAGRVAPDDLQRLRQRRQIDPEAFESYVRGRYFWNKRSQADFSRAADEFSHAIDVDPMYAAAYAGLADTYSQMGYLNSLAPREAYPKARAAAKSALDRDPDLAEPHASLGFIHLYFDWDFESAERELKRAIALDPSSVTARHSYSILLTATLRPEEARQQIKAAHDLDPFSVLVSTDMGFEEYYDRQYAAATAALQDAIKRYPQAPLAHFWLARTYQAQGRFDDAIAEYQKVGPVLAATPTLLSGLGHLYGTLGRRSDALSVLDMLNTLASRQFVSAYSYALVHLGLGDKKQTIDWLERSYEERALWMVWLLKDPRWDPMRGDPRFEEIVSRVGFPSEARARAPRPRP